MHRTNRRPSLPVRLVLLPSASTGSSAFLRADLDSIAILRSLDPALGQPFVSSALLLLARRLGPARAFDSDRLTPPPSIDLSGLAPFPDAWIPLASARKIARELAVDDLLAGLLAWGNRRMASWVERGPNEDGMTVAHNWRPPSHVLADYSLARLLALPDLKPTEVVMVDDTMVMRTPLSLELAEQQATSGGANFPLPHACQATWFALVRLTGAVHAAAADAAASEGADVEAAVVDSQQPPDDVVCSLVSHILALPARQPTSIAPRPEADARSDPRPPDGRALAQLLRAVRRAGLPWELGVAVVDWLGEAVAARIWVERCCEAGGTIEEGSPQRPMTSSLADQQPAETEVIARAVRRALGPTLDGLAERLAGIERSLLPPLPPDKSAETLPRSMGDGESAPAAGGKSSKSSRTGTGVPFASTSAGRARRSISLDRRSRPPSPSLAGRSDASGLFEAPTSLLARGARDGSPVKRRVLGLGPLGWSFIFDTLLVAIVCFLLLSRSTRLAGSSLRSSLPPTRGTTATRQPAATRDDVLLNRQSALALHRRLASGAGADDGS